MSSSSFFLDRWQSAHLIDSETADRIRNWESEQAPANARRWPAVLALAFGALLLTAGLLLFVSAHWDQMSPGSRFGLVIATIVALHGAAALVERSSPALSMTLHAVGTLSLGGAIALTGQIFHLQEHWPGGIMLWAAGAAAGWAILRQWPQAALTAILVPAWLASECFAFHVFIRMRETAPAFAGLCALSLIYLGARQANSDSKTRQALSWIGAITVLPFAIFCGVEHWSYSFHEPRQIAAWIIAAVAPLAVGWALAKNSKFHLVASGVIVGWTAMLTWIAANSRGPGELLLYIWYAAGSAGLAWWGVEESRAERINLGLAGFALTVLFFYFSSVMDKLGRSASLITLGLLFLGGGWLLEQTRRRLMSQIGGLS